MSGVTVDRTGSIVEMLGLYSARLESLREDLLALHQKVKSLTSDFQSSLTAALAVAEPSNPGSATDLLDLVDEADAFAARDPEIGAEIEFFHEEIAPLQFADGTSIQAPADDLERITGIDATAAETLGGFGIRTYSDLAGIDTDEAVAIGMLLGDADRISREGWIEQAIARSDDGTAHEYAGLDIGREPAAATTPATTSAGAIDIDATTAMAESPEPEPTPLTIDPFFDNIVIEQDPTTRQLIKAAAALAEAIAAQKQRERLAAEDSASADVVAISTAANIASGTNSGPDSDSGSDTAAVPPSTTGAEIIDLAAHRVQSRTRRSRPRAIAASLVLLLLAGVAVGTSAEHILGFDMTALASCGEALLLGDTSCVDLPASIL